MDEYQDNNQIPAKILYEGQQDPARKFGAAPNFSQDVVPHVHTTAGRVGIASHAYMTLDEATRHSRQNAERMRKDCGIMECIEARQRAVALLPWHIEPENDKDQEQQQLASLMTKLINESYYFTSLRTVMQDAVWYGRSGVALRYGHSQVGTKWYKTVQHWEPRHADKLVFRFDDGSGQHVAEQVGIRVSTAFRKQCRIGTTKRDQIQPTEQGLVYWLNRTERDTILIHKHMVEDGPFEEPRSAGRIHGVGVRDRIYWTWYAMTECLQRVMEYLDRAAYGIEVWPYPAGNPMAKTETEAAAFSAMGGGRTVILAPINQVETPEIYLPRLIEPGLGGVNTTMDVIRTFFMHKIKRYILGQTLSSEADATGMGSGVADAHLATLADILTYDARNQEETLTKQLVKPLQRWNFPGTNHIGLKFVIDTESDNVMEKLQAFQSAWQMGLEIKADEVYRVIGTAKPEPDDRTLSNPQIAYAQQYASQQGVQVDPASGGAVISPETMQDAFHGHMHRALAGAA